MEGKDKSKNRQHISVRKGAPGQAENNEQVVLLNHRDVQNYLFQSTGPNEEPIAEAAGQGNNNSALLPLNEQEDSRILLGGIVSPEDNLEVDQVKNGLLLQATSRRKSSAVDFNYTETLQSNEDQDGGNGIQPPNALVAKETSVEESQQCQRRS